MIIQNILHILEPVDATVPPQYNYNTAAYGPAYVNPNYNHQALGKVNK